MRTHSFLLHKCGHECVTHPDDRRSNFKPSDYVCYACRDLPGTETCRTCKVRGEWVERRKETAIQTQLRGQESID
jgi:hypothetical protein